MVIRDGLKKITLQVWKVIEVVLKNIRKIVDHTIYLKIPHLTLFALSSENFKRPSLQILYDIIYENFSNQISNLINEKNVKIKVIGIRNSLPKKIISIIEDAEKNSEKFYIKLKYSFQLWI